VNNTKQIVLALQNYHDTHKIFPSGRLFYRRSNGRIGNTSQAQQAGGRSNQYAASWMVLMLPFVEQQTLFDQYNPDYRMKNVNNRPVRSAYITGYTCPSDSWAKPNNPLVRYNNQWARASYGYNGGRLVAGNYLRYHRWNELPTANRGVMGNTGAAEISDVLDGTSTTVAVWEIRAGTRGSDPRGVWALGRGTMVGGCDNQGDCQGINDQTGNPDDVHHCQADPTAKMPCWSGGDGQHGPKSLHPGGCHAGMVDGSARFVSQDINQNQVMRALNSISNNEPLPEF
jgi:hypothetical protein